MARAKPNTIALAVYPELIKHAMARTKPTYGDVALAIGRDPTKESLTIVPALKTIHAWCAKQGYPSLDALVVSSGTGEVGEWLSNKLDPEAERQRVYAFDRWHLVNGPALTGF